MKLPPEKVLAIIDHRANGCGIRQTAHFCHVDPATVMHHSVLVGEGCERLLDRMMRGLQPNRLELDELHTFIHTKERRKREDAPAEHGDVWGFLTEDARSRAIVAWELGKRETETFESFIRQLRARTVGRLHLNTDGWNAYKDVIERVLGDEVDYARIVKEYKPGRNARGLPVADEFVSATPERVFGNPDMDAASTSYAERFNLTVRLLVSKFGRRTPKHAKSLLHLRADLMLMIAYYNFVRIHSTIKQTPAHALGITDRAWSFPELVKKALDAIEEPAPEPLELPPIAPRETCSRAPAKRQNSSDKAVPQHERHVKPSLNPHQQTVLDIIQAASGSIKISEIYPKAFPNLPPKQADSWTRNQLRKLTALKLVEWVGKGTYRAIKPEHISQAAAEMVGVVESVSVPPSVVAQ